MSSCVKTFMHLHHFFQNSLIYEITKSKSIWVFYTAETVE